MVPSKYFGAFAPGYHNSRDVADDDDDDLLARATGARARRASRIANARGAHAWDARLEQAAIIVWKKKTRKSFFFRALTCVKVRCATTTTGEETMGDRLEGRPDRSRRDVDRDWGSRL